MIGIEQQQREEEEEFQEADILWPEAAQDLKLTQMYYSLVDGEDDEEEDEYSAQHYRPVKPRPRPRPRPRGRQKASSPIDIPGRKGGVSGARGANAPAGFGRYGQSLASTGGDGSLVVGSRVLVPPHVIVDHRRARRDKAMMMMMLVVPKGRLRTMAMRE
ncbi:hypothetical protein GUJ93_ZPchr0001g29576 [Zizania palustris]|uniref:Uncharacterized protein n=1 Tax=Zizania palustris TaxID=103762 RepID=A0A8J5RKT7_ZIZPA|nr:hypothetical protein GUJ93_ZPchr0001g29576 [Zizania palustris]